MVKPVWKRIGVICLAAFFAVWGVFSLFLPLPKIANAEEGRCLCTWQDGSVTEETYATAYGDLAPDENGALRLCRGNLYGEISPTAKYSAIVRTLQAGGLADLLALSSESVTRLERLALWRFTQGCIWYGSGYFVWNGNGFVEVDFAEGERLILLSGSISASRLKKTGVKYLELHAEAEIDFQTLVGTKVERVNACPPYSVVGGAVYLDVGTAVRLVAVLPAMTALTVSGNDYADEGALLAAQKLQSLTIPFAGNAPVWSHYFYGEVAYLFSDGKEYSVPSALQRVKITGGILVSHAFYRMDAVEEIDLCGMDVFEIAPDALVDCTALKRVHSPNANLELSGEFTSSAAPCGCTVFERIG